MNSLFGALLIVGSALVPTAHAQEVPLPPVHIFMTVAAQPSVMEMVTSAEAQYALDDTFLRTLECESGLNPNAVGDHDTSYGVAQIHLPAHADITKAQALDPEYAVYWAAQQFAAGHADLWTCYRNLKA